jgi:hypothetical protein
VALRSGWSPKCYSLRRLYAKGRELRQGTLKKGSKGYSIVLKEPLALGSLGWKLRSPMMHRQQIRKLSGFDHFPRGQGIGALRLREHSRTRILKGTRTYLAGCLGLVWLASGGLHLCLLN